MSEERFEATYRVRASATGIEARALALALEQSVEMPLEGVRDAAIRAGIVAQVRSIAADAQFPGAHAVRIAFAQATIGTDPGQLFNMLFGNCALQNDVELIDVDLSPSLARTLGGPRHGIAGIRAAVGARDRAITCSALKPQGQSPEELARLAASLARAGIDVVKDDHGIADQACAPFAERVPAVQRAVDAVNRAGGGRTVYAPTFSGAPTQIARQVRIAADAGVRMALACPMLIGIPCFHELARVFLDCPILAHPALAGVRIAPALLVGTMFRLIGADAVIYPNHGGRFAWSPDECARVARNARAPLHGLAPAMPVPAGGMRVERVPEMLEFYGPDTMLLIGGNLLVADDVEARAREFVVAVRRGPVR